MLDEQLPELPPLPELVRSLAVCSDQLEDHLKQATAIGMSHIDSEDYLMIASLRRAHDNARGMAAMVAQKNLSCGMPIVRFQLDTAMTLFGRRLVSDVEDYVTHMMKGQERRKFRDKDNEEMTDAYLHRKMTKTHGFTSVIYAYASGFVHFSTHHLHMVIDLDLFRRAEEMVLRSHDRLESEWSDEEMRVAIVQFLFASDIILEDCEGWEKSRRSAPPPTT